MSEMVERVMRAIAENQHQGWIYDEVAVSLCDPVRIAERREYLRMAACAAIEAMREPTKDMLEHAKPHMDSQSSNLAWWDKMIDAALMATPSIALKE